MNVGHYLALNARRHPEKLALTHNDRTYTYDELNRTVNRMANGLRELGIQKGEKVALMLTNTDAFPISYYALAKIGAVIVPMNFRLVAGEVGYILKQSESIAVIADDAFEQIIGEAKTGAPDLRHVIVAPAAGLEGHLSFKDILSAGTDEPGIAVMAEDDLQILYTSGTTGRPKGALFDHMRVLKGNIAFTGTLGFNVDDRFMHVAPLFHSAQLNIFLNPGIFLGLSNFVVREFNPVKVLEAIEKYRITYFFGVPAMYNMMLQASKSGDFDLSSIRNCAYGAAPMAVPLVRQSMDLFKTDRFYSLAGLTEGGPSGVYLSPDDHRTKIGCSGKRPLLLTEARLVDSEGNDTPPGVHGELVLRSEIMMKEYYKKAAETAETIVDGWLHTGDVAVMDEDGFITFVDRIKDMIISGGENIYSVEVENVLYKLPKVLEAAVVGTPDLDWGEKVNAVVVLKPGESAEGREIQDFCRLHMAGYKIPRNVVFVDSLPRNASGKLLKYEIRRQLREMQAQAGPA
ncbi:MAG: long-chain-fatty-acid--CoA ligase [Deltaproteobacteria bacterium]|jgi:acyl-CoA synthetase (AMP-forming)/AMP-acid ligase II|nr:long-chain-fatty-acid--CoA ligase [Deltaproteobacteria bacterium]MDA8306071.1 long-chain-fatty-acid--CoA ligase [Deltaproteobacteria bacterium]